MCSWLFLHPLGFVYFSFLLRHILPLLCVSPLCCHYLRLSRGFFCLMFIPISFFSLFLFRFLSFLYSYSDFFLLSILHFSFFRCGCSLRAFPLPFERSIYLSFLLFAELSIFTNGSPRVAFALVLPSCGFCLRVIFLSAWCTPTSVPDPVFASWLVRLCFVIRRCTIIAIGFAFFFPLCFSLLSLSSGVSASVHDIFCLSIVCLPDCVSLHTALLDLSLSPRLLLLRGLAASLALRLLRSSFSWGFLSFTGFLFGSFTSEFRWCSPAGIGTLFSCLSFDLWAYFFYFLLYASV